MMGLEERFNIQLDEEGNDIFSKLIVSNYYSFYNQKLVRMYVNILW